MATAQKSTTGLPSNTAGALCYLGAWVTGLIFLLVERNDSFVRFHAMQSIVFFGGLTILMMVPIIGWILTPILALIGFAVWLVMLYKAYRGEKYLLPLVGSFAEKQLGRF